MSFGLTAQGLKIKRLNDILTEKRIRYKAKFGENFDVSDESPAGQIIAIEAEREASLWELAQGVYNSKYRATAEGASLDNVLALTGSSRRNASYSTLDSGVAYGTDGTIIPIGTIVSVQGNPSSKFKTLETATINIADGDTFKSDPIKLQAVNTGVVYAQAGTLTVIDTPVPGLDTFTNTLDAALGSEIETDSQAKLRTDEELQLAGSATIEAILSELKARTLVEAVIVFQNKTSVVDADGRPPHSLDIVVLGDEDQDIGEAIFKVVGGGIETIGDILVNVTDSQGFNQINKFSRPSEVPVWVEIDLVTDPNLFPANGAQLVEDLIVAYGLAQTVGKNVIVFGTNGLGGAFDTIPGINDFEIKIGKTSVPVSDDNVLIAPREIAKFDSSRITVNVV